MMRPIVVLGCTAAGKSDLAEAIARQLAAKAGVPVPVMAVDSMQVYRGMDIGTAKPSPAVLAEMPYWMVDLCDPWETYSVARFVEAARPMVEQRVKAGLPLVIVAGTFLYLRALIDGLFEGPGADESIRAELNGRAEREGTAALHAELMAVDPVAAGRIHANDIRRIVRALEVFRLTGKPITVLQTQWSAEHPAVDAVFIGIQRDKELLNRRINARVKKMLEAGLVNEVRKLANDPRGFSQEAASGVGYRQLLDHFAGNCSLEEAVEQIKIQTRYLAKMQRTWLKRWPAQGSVKWIDAAEGVEGASLVHDAMAAIEKV